MVRKSKSPAVSFRLVFLAVLFLITGCAPNYLITVDAITAPSAPEGKEYFLLPGQIGLSANDLHFQEYSAYVVTLLADKGYRQITKKEESRLLIYLGYGIGAPQPTAYANFAGLPQAPPAPAGMAPGPDPAMTMAYSLRYGAPWPYSPYYPGYYRDFRFHHGFRPGYFPDYYDYYQPLEVYPLYQRYLVLEAVDYRASKSRKEIVPVWKVTVSNWGEHDDLREVLPALAAAAGEYIGTNTGKEIEVSLSGNDVRIMRLKNLR